MVSNKILIHVQLLFISFLLCLILSKGKLTCPFILGSINLDWVTRLKIALDAT